MIGLPYRGVFVSTVLSCTCVRLNLIKTALLAAEEEAAGGVKVKKAPGGAKKKGGKKKDDLSFLEDSLISGAEKKARDKKKKEADKKEAERKRLDEAAKKKEESSGSLTGGGIVDVNDVLAVDGEIVSNVNRADDDEGASGLEGALSVFNFSDASGVKPERQRALHLAFEERMLPEMREQYPNLKLSQYKDKIFALWQKSPENPRNQEIPNKK